MAGVTILGISPGTKYLGIALMRNGDLYEWKVKTYKGSWNEEKLQKILNHLDYLLITHVVTQVACKVPHMEKCSQALKMLIERIKGMAAEYRLPFHQYSIEELKYNLDGDIRNKSFLADYITSLYPELTPILVSEKENKNPYHTKVFEAVATTRHCHISLKKT